MQPHAWDFAELVHLVFVSARVCAIWGRNLWIFTFVLLLALIEPATLLVCHSCMDVGDKN